MEGRSRLASGGVASNGCPCRHPFARVRDAGIAQRQTAAVYLKQLRDIGVVQEVKVGREKLYINLRLMRLLTAERPGDLSFPASRTGADRSIHR